MKQLTTAVISGLILIFTIVLLSFPFGREMIPQIGQFFSEREGIWQNVRQTEFPESQIQTSSFLSDTVRIQRDENGIPYIYAHNSRDAIWALGYVTARDRLFQLLLIPGVISGKTAEWFGDDYFETDKAYLNLGFEEAAWQIHNSLSDEEYQMIQAYQTGINNYISTHFYSRTPFEFKILNLNLRYWRPVDVIRAFLFWRYITAYSEKDIAYQHAIDSLGVSRFKEIYLQEPSDKKISTSNINTSELDEYLSEQSKKRAKILGSFQQLIEATLLSFSDIENVNSEMGINLSTPLTLPSLFYEVYISLPGNNMYGLTMPGIPAILYGSNSNIQWGQANADRDPVDYLNMKSEGFNRTEKTRIKEYKILSNTGKSVNHSVKFSAPGTVIGEGDNKVILNWKGTQYNREILKLWELNQANTVDEAEASIQRKIGPRTVFVVSEAGKNSKFYTGSSSDIELGIQSTARSVYMKSASTNVHNSSGLITAQSISDYENETYWKQQYLAYLSNEKKLKSGDLKGQELSTVLPQRNLLPYLEEAVRKSDQRSLKDFYEIFSSWKFTAETDSKAPVFLERFMQILRNNIWDELGDLPYPSDEIWMHWLEESVNHQMFDIESTAVRENGMDVLLKAFNDALELTEMEYGNAESWYWSTQTTVGIGHFSGLPVFNRFTDFSITHKGFVGTIHPFLKRQQITGSTWQIYFNVKRGQIKARTGSISGSVSNPFSPYFSSGLHKKLKNSSTNSSIPWDQSLHKNSGIIIYPLK